MRKLIIFILIITCLLSCGALVFQKNITYCGVNWVGTKDMLAPGCFSELNDLNANSVAIIPFAYGNTKTGELTTSTSWQWWGESFEGSKRLAQMAKNHGLKVMIKPQIWFDHGTFTGDVILGNEDKWETLENGYRYYILTHAHNAQEVNADIFCIGTELKNFIKNRPEFWSSLIDEVKSIYSGKLTYAGNWDSFYRFPFWKNLDYIGVDAYFPLSDKKTPTVSEIKDGWSKHIPFLSAFSDSLNRKILFCEYGFRSKPFNSAKPWDSEKSNDIDFKAQENAYQGTFESVWTEDFMAGGFLWKWYPEHMNAGGENCNRFTPQNKPSQAVITRFYKNN